MFSGLMPRINGIVFVVARLPPPQRYGAAGINAQTWAMLPKPPTLNYSSINDQLTLNHMLSAATFSDRGWLKKSAKSCSRETPIELFDRVEITSLFLIAKESDAFASV